MGRHIAFVVPMTPIGKGRARSTRDGHHYTPEATVTGESIVRNAFRAAYPMFTAHQGPVEFSVIAEFPIPQSWPKYKKLAARMNLWRHTSKPDVSNIQKLVEDALCANHKTMGATGALYADDSAICNGNTRKMFGPVGRLVVRATLFDQPTRAEIDSLSAVAS